MTRERTTARRSHGRFAGVLLVALGGLVSASCVETIRVPLAVPLSPVAGARPATPSGLLLGIDFGDGLWGQEQERAEMVGGGIGFAADDRVEVNLGGSWSTRTVRNSSGNPHTGEPTNTVRVKVRLADFWDTRGAVGLHVARSSASRVRDDVQADYLTALDIAVPIEIYRTNGPLDGTRLGAYIAPRVMLQIFEDRRTRPWRTTKGTMLGALVGVAGRWRYIALSGELNFVRTPLMHFENATFGNGWHLLPTGRFRVMLPLGD
jgi:hypothetical protein